MLWYPTTDRHFRFELAFYWADPALYVDIVRRPVSLSVGGYTIRVSILYLLHYSSKNLVSLQVMEQQSHCILLVVDVYVDRGRELAPLDGVVVEPLGEVIVVSLPDEYFYYVMIYILNVHVLYFCDHVLL